MVKVAISAPASAIAVGARHRTENLALDALHGEQRHEGRDRDGGRKEHRLVDLQRADQDQAQSVGPHWPPDRRRLGRIGAPPFLGQVLQHRLPLPPGCAWKLRNMFSTKITAESTMMPKSTAPTDSRLASSPQQHQDDDAEEQRERDVDADDDGAAQVAEEYPLDQEHQEAAEDQVVHHRVGGDGDERGAVIERHELARPAARCRRC